MGSFPKYMKQQFRLHMFLLDHHSQSQFIISCWQRNHSYLPLLICRGLLFMFSLGIVLTSMIMLNVNFSFWFIYMTHWGILFVMLTTGTAFAISLLSFLDKLKESETTMPWITKLYWVLFNITTPTAFMITIFYYSFLTDAVEDYAPNPTLDLLVHGMNSVIMMVQLLLAWHPSRILHFYHPILFGVVYGIFSAIYSTAGGLDPFGNTYIYPMVDWTTNPALAGNTFLLTALLILIAHILVVAIAVGRNAVAKAVMKSSSSTWTPA